MHEGFKFWERAENSTFRFGVNAPLNLSSTYLKRFLVVARMILVKEFNEILKSEEGCGRLSGTMELVSAKSACDVLSRDGQAWAEGPRLAGQMDHLAKQPAHQTHNFFMVLNNTIKSVRHLEALEDSRRKSRWASNGRWANSFELPSSGCPQSKFLEFPHTLNGARTIARFLWQRLKASLTT